MLIIYNSHGEVDAQISTNQKKKPELLNIHLKYVLKLFPGILKELRSKLFLFWSIFLRKII